MAASHQWFGQAATGIVARQWVPTQIGVVLMQASYVPNIDTQLRYSDISGSELTAGGGYTVGGQELLGRSTSYDAAANEYNLIATDPAWGPGATFSARYAVVYEMATTDKYLWSLLDFGSLFSVSSGTFQIDFTSNPLSIQTGPAV
jgi:hypothetical protein